MVAQSQIACNELTLNKINAELINVHTIKPLDKKVIKLLSKFKNIVTVEEHSIMEDYIAS